MEEINEQQINNNTNILNYENNDLDTNEEDSCLICFNPVDKIIILCKSCKFLYCTECANKVKFCCAVCNRNKNKINIRNRDHHPLQNTCLAAFLFFIMSGLVYIIIFGTFSYYFYINYSPYYQFIIYAKNSDLLDELVYKNKTLFYK